MDDLKVAVVGIRVTRVVWAAPLLTDGGLTTQYVDDIKLYVWKKNGHELYDGVNMRNHRQNT